MEDVQFYVSSERIVGDLHKPVGLMFHGTRSGIDRSIDDEYRSNRAWAINNIQRDVDGSIWYLGWHVTIGNDRYAPHMSVLVYGWNAGGDSVDRISYEFAQPRRGDPITDAQIRAACAYTRKHVRDVYPDLYDNLLDHGSDMIVEHWQTAQGRRYGKSDVDPDHPGLLAERFLTELRK